ncbi:MAG: PilZ domain-containing protein [Phycisphaerae bacterium]|nr:PilZ domain-containing protein [Phycisphaerae bacterium]
MTRGEALKPDQIRDFLLSSIQEHADVVLSFTRQGKWRLHHTQICCFGEDFIVLEEDTSPEGLIENQPVGICAQLGHFKYLFETSVQSVEAKGPYKQIHLDFPEKVEQMQRRAFERHPVPSNLKVKSLFWHRGYLDDSQENPLEQYWQGRLLNLSAGGAQIAVDLDLKDYFREGQLVGVQFTPMSYQRPLLLEAHVKYLVDQSEHNQFLVGVEFLGLEAGPEGREVLHRLVRVIHDYEKMNRQHNTNSLTA